MTNNPDDLALKAPLSRQRKIPNRSRKVLKGKCQQLLDNQWLEALCGATITGDYCFTIGNMMIRLVACVMKLIRVICNFSWPTFRYIEWLISEKLLIAGCDDSHRDWWISLALVIAQLHVYVPWNDSDIRSLVLMRAESCTTKSIVIYIRNYFNQRRNTERRRKCQVHAYEWRSRCAALSKVNGGSTLYFSVSSFKFTIGNFKCLKKIFTNRSVICLVASSRLDRRALWILHVSLLCEIRIRNGRNLSFFSWTKVKFYHRFAIKTLWEKCVLHTMLSRMVNRKFETRALCKFLISCLFLP